MFANLQIVLTIVQRIVSGIGIFIIVSGVAYAGYKYFLYLCQGKLATQSEAINSIRLILGRVLILGLEFIVAADLIGTTTTPDYYDLGMLGIIVLIRTMLNFSINRELMSLKKE